MPALPQSKGQRWPQVSQAACSTSLLACQRGRFPQLSVRVTLSKGVSAPGRQWLLRRWHSLPQAGRVCLGVTLLETPVVSPAWFCSPFWAPRLYSDYKHGLFRNLMNAVEVRVIYQVSSFLPPLSCETSFPAAFFSFEFSIAIMQHKRKKNKHHQNVHWSTLRNTWSTLTLITKENTFLMRPNYSVEQHNLRFLRGMLCILPFLYL